MQAATSVVAQALERMVMMLAISGSMAVFASWKKVTQAAKISSGRLVNRVINPAVLVRPCARPPWARTGSISFGGMCTSVISVGTISAAVTRNTA